MKEVKGENITKLISKKNQMNQYLYQEVEDSYRREKLLDQIKWLNYEIEHYKHANNLELLIDEFNWVVSNFNEELHLDQEEKFPYFRD